MRITSRCSEEIGTSFSFDKERGVCQILNDSQNVLVEIDTIINIIDEYKLSDYDVKLLYNNREDCTEESIYQVKIQQKRIGWIFPIQAIHSIEHKEAGNDHFLKYAYVAWQYLLSSCEDEIDDFDQFDLFEKYPESANLLVLDKGNCRNENFDYENYVISLYDYGYAEAGEGNLYTPDKNPDIAINLKPISSDIGDATYINLLFKRQIPLESNPVTRFYIYYQLIEILITKVFDNLFIDFVSKLRVSSENLFDQKEDLNKYSNEKYRLTRLCNDYSKIEDTALINELKEKCIELLEYTNSKKTGDQMPESLYYVRCLLVHRMYVLDKDSEETLEKIDDLFLELCIKLLLTFRTLKKD